MVKQNRTWTEGSIDQVPEMEITWNWQSSRFLVKLPFIAPCYIYKFSKWNYGKPGKILECMGEETTYLLAISNDTKDPKNFQPITFLSKTYKLLISFVTDRTYSHLKQNDFFLRNRKEVDVVRMVANLWSIKTNLRTARNGNKIWVIHGLTSKKHLIVFLMNGS